MRRLRADDRELWHRAMHDVAPLRGRSSTPAPELSPNRGRPARNVPTDQVHGLKAQGTAAVQAAATPSPSPRPPAPQPLPPLDRFAGVDRATAERLKRGRYPVAAQLDLHGMTQAEAHNALAGFVARSRAAGRRCLLVITGHGRMSGGILKAAVPRWLGEPDLRRHVLAIAPAQPDSGGSGALYVLLRRVSPAGN
jgi:DNA-nicking Smr family endonuclease